MGKEQPDKPDIVERLLAACSGHPAAKIPWSYGVLREAIEEIKALRAEIQVIQEMKNVAQRGLLAGAVITKHVDWLLCNPEKCADLGHYLYEIPSPPQSPVKIQSPQEFMHGYCERHNLPAIPWMHGADKIAWDMLREYAEYYHVVKLLNERIKSESA
jgi:hypothetical protein